MTAQLKSTSRKILKCYEGVLELQESSTIEADQHVLMKSSIKTIIPNIILKLVEDEMNQLGAKG